MANGVFPSRNLGAGENWGRSVEQEIKQSRNKESELESRVASVNRSIAGNLNRITGLESYTTRAVHYTGVVTNFAIRDLSPEYNRIVSVDIPPISGFSRVHLQVSALHLSYLADGADRSNRIYGFVRTRGGDGGIASIPPVPTSPGTRNVQSTIEEKSDGRRGDQIGFTGGCIIDVISTAATVDLWIAPTPGAPNSAYPAFPDNVSSLDILATYYPDPDTRV